ncbi:MAG: hypothetical protein QOH24_2024 [Verrucomicrobiota bacterium]|jgi:hypothetical protein
MSTSTSDGQVSAPKTDAAWSLVYYTALALIVLVAAYERFHLPPSPLADNDSWGYLGPAVLKLGGVGFQHTNSRNFLYPGFLLLILGLTNNLGAITIIQHLLGLGTGGLMICCWAKTKRFVRHISPRMHDALGLALGAMYLLSRHPIEYEHLLRPEAITPFFAILNILLTLHFFDIRRREGPSWSGAIIAALVLVSAILLVTLRTSFALTIFFSGLPVLIALFDRRETQPRRAAVILVTLISAAAVLRTEQILAESDPVAKWWLPTTLFTIHANLIAQQMDEDITRGDCGPSGCEWLHQVSASLHEEIEKSRHLRRFWRSLGFDPDYLMYEDSLRRWRDRFFNGDMDKQLRFEMSYYLRTVRMHPGRIGAKVMQQMAQFYLGYKQSFATPQVKLDRRYSRALDALQPYLLLSYPPFTHYLEKLKSLSFSKATLNQPVLVTAAGALLSFLYPPIFFATLGVVCVLSPDQRRLYGSFAVVVLFALSYSFGNCLITAITHSLDLSRYIVAQYSFVLLSEWMAILFLFEIGMETRRRRGEVCAHHKQY